MKLYIMSSLKDIEITDDYVNNKYYDHDMVFRDI